MNTIKYLLFFALITVISCNTSTKEKTRKIYTPDDKITELELKLSKDKIFLLADIKKTSPDTIFSILKEYMTSFTELRNYNAESEIIYNETIQKLAYKYKFPKSKIASIVYSYKYEMLTLGDKEETSLEEFDPNIPDRD